MEINIIQCGVDKNDEFTKMINDQFLIINDMGMAPVVAAMTEVLGIPEAVNRLIGAADPRKKVDTGTALEEIGNCDFHKLYSEICMHSLELHGAIAEEIHVDGTNISVYGEYNSPSPNDFKVTFGDPKSKLRDLKQLNIGLYVQQN